MEAMANMVPGVGVGVAALPQEKVAKADQDSSSLLVGKMM